MPWPKGKPKSKEHREKLAAAQRGESRPDLIGPGNPMWDPIVRERHLIASRIGNQRRLVTCLDCGLAYGEYEHPPGQHYDPTKYPCCCSDGCHCGSDNAWGFCSVCLAELYGQAMHTDSHEGCSLYKPEV
jgi:hypothetical protein